MQPVFVRLPSDLLAWLDCHAHKAAENRSTAIRSILRQEMDRQARAARRATARSNSRAGAGHP